MDKNDEKLDIKNIFNLVDRGIKGKFKDKKPTLLIV